MPENDRKADDTPEDLIERLLAGRAAGRTLCPSEVARKLAKGGECWRDRMAEVHAAVDGLLARQSVALSWKGEPLPRREGPYRIGRPH
jgi:hypothetical protein